MKKYFLIVLLSFLSGGVFAQAYVDGPANCIVGTAYTFTTVNNTEPIKYWALYGPMTGLDTTTTANTITLTFTEPGTYYLVCGYDLQITVTAPLASNLITFPELKFDCTPLRNQIKSGSLICKATESFAEGSDQYAFWPDNGNLTEAILKNKRRNLISGYLYYTYSG